MIYLISDQPTTCPKCGGRTDQLSSMLHTNAKALVEECLNTQCRYIFISEDDAEIDALYEEGEPEAALNTPVV